MIPDLKTYLDLNGRYGDPFVFWLTRRGFFSEVNNLLNAVLFGLLTKRRLVVDQSKFLVGRWEDFYEAELPRRRLSDLPMELCAACLRRPARRRQKALIGVRHAVKKWWESKVPIVVPELSIDGDMFSAKRQLAGMLCVPRRNWDDGNGARPAGDFAACHIRRGDKTIGVQWKGRLIIEGEETPTAAYLSEILRYAPDIRQIFVMTDDTRLVDDLRTSMAAGTAVHTICQPSREGYFQEQFNSIDQVARQAEIRQLLLEVDIAASSRVFVGAYLSNVSRYVALVHKVPEACFSADSLTEWHPL